MMRLPRLRGTRPAGDIHIQFKGLNMTDAGQKGQFVDMVDVSSDRFPILSPSREHRRNEIDELVSAYVSMDDLYVVIDDALYKGNRRNEIDKIASWKTSDPYAPTTLIPFGAYIIILPEKKMYNTADGTLQDMDNSFLSEGTVTYKQSWLTEVEDEDELDPEGQTYVKISAAGIDEGFKKGDGVEVRGFDEEALNGHHVIKDIGDGWIKIIAAIDKDGSETGTVKVTRYLPECDFWTVSENRLWGCSSKNHEIYASKLGDPTNFYCYEETADSSYAATVATPGEFTGAITYLGYVMFFKEDSIHKVYGSKPSNFQIIEGKLRGVEKGCGNTLQIVNEVLYYKSRDGVMSFQGTMPQCVSDELGRVKGPASAGVLGDKYYISMNKDGYALFVYDTKRGLWHKEQTDAPIDKMTRHGDELYMVFWQKGYPNTICIGGSDKVTDNEWYADTCDYTCQTADSKFVHRISLRCEVPEGAYINVWIDYDSRGAWELLKTVGFKTKGIVNVPLIPRRCDHFKLRFEGYGDCAIHDMTLYLTQGSKERRW